MPEHHDEPQDITEVISRARRDGILFPLPKIDFESNGEKRNRWQLDVDTENQISLRINWDAGEQGETQTQWSIRGPITTNPHEVILAVGSQHIIASHRITELSFRPLRKAASLERPSHPDHVWGFKRFLGTVIDLNIYGPRRFMPLEQLTGKVIASCLMYSVIDSLWAGEYKSEHWELLLSTEAASRLPVEARVAIDLGLQMARPQP